jgi:thiamine pyrophosphate-dependent acetolactate synthase large subunit-like protein
MFRSLEMPKRGRGGITVEQVEGGHLVARQLVAEGIDTVFGVMAGPMQYAFRAAPKEGLRVIGCRHEEQAGFMAQAWGYLTGKAGVVMAGSGPGMANTLPAMHVAQESALPLVVLGGSVASKERGVGGFQEADQMAMARPVCKWAIQVDSVERIPEYIHMAMGKAVSGRPGAVYLDFPAELLWKFAPETALESCATPTTVYRPHPDPAAIDRVADMVAEAQRPLVLIGKGAAWSGAGAALTSLTDLGLPFVASPMARGVVSDDHPMNAAAVRSYALSNADVVVMVGGRFNWIFPPYHRGRNAASAPRLVQIDVEPEEFHGGVNLEIGIVADAGAACELLQKALSGRQKAAAQSEWLTDLNTRRAEKTLALDENLKASGTPINHYQVWREVRDAVDRDAIIVMDGEHTPGVGRIVMPGYLPRHRLDIGTTSCMGIGVPYALGAKAARPDAQVVAVLGDYAFGASAMEIETAARLGLAVTFVVDNNCGIGGKFFQDAWFGLSGQPVAELLPARYDRMAEMVGGHHEHVEKAEDLGPAIRRALKSDTVSIVNVMTDPMDHGLKRGPNYLTTGYYFTEVESVGY